jgi:hypothetical protein
MQITGLSSTDDSTTPESTRKGGRKGSRKVRTGCKTCKYVVFSPPRNQNGLHNFNNSADYGKSSVMKGDLPARGASRPGNIVLDISK